MEKPVYHFFVCSSFRLNGDPKGYCHKNNSGSLLQYLEEAVNDRGLNAQITSTGCMKACDRGPVMTVYPQGLWYGKVDEDKIDEILDALEAGQTADQYQLV